jgi:hypothetical protein
MYFASKISLLSLVYCSLCMYAPRSAVSRDASRAQGHPAHWRPNAQSFAGHHDMTDVFELIRKTLDLK